MTRPILGRANIICVFPTLRRAHCALGYPVALRLVKVEVQWWGLGMRFPQLLHFAVVCASHEHTVIQEKHISSQLRYSRTVIRSY